MERVFNSHNKRVIDAIFMVIFDWTRWFEKCVCLYGIHMCSPFMHTATMNEFTREHIVEHILCSPPWMVCVKRFSFFHKNHNTLSANKHHTKSMSTLWQLEKRTTYVGSEFFRIPAICEANRTESIWRHKLIQSFHFYLIEIQVWIGNTPLCMCAYNKFCVVGFFIQHNSNKNWICCTLGYFRCRQW